MGLHDEITALIRQGRKDRKRPEVIANAILSHIQCENACGRVGTHADGLCGTCHEEWHRSLDDAELPTLTDDECAFLARYCVTIRDRWKRTASDAHHHKDIVRREKAFDQIAMVNHLAEKLERIGAAAAIAEAGGG